MTVGELIKRPQQLDPEMPVLVEGHETGFDDIASIEPVSVFAFPDAPGWDGEYQTPAGFTHDEPTHATHEAMALIGRREILRIGVSPRRRLS